MTALTVWWSHKEVIGKLPLDACPYQRPFRKDFADCSAFQPVEFNAASSDVPPQMLTSCANLGIGTFWNEAKHHYARCGLGDGSARLARLKAQLVVSESYVLQHADPDDEAFAPPPIMPPR
ncbi:MAG TPA: hypothetical protein VN973_14755 [Candidatus Dormibacteraeota bacterium]|nr:hypothetical protein [Candidatus Dormibacteraeota bacterium]